MCSNYTYNILSHKKCSKYIFGNNIKSVLFMYVEKLACTQ